MFKAQLSCSNHGWALPPHPLCCWRHSSSEWEATLPGTHPRLHVCDLWSSSLCSRCCTNHGPPCKPSKHECHCFCWSSLCCLFGCTGAAECIPSGQRWTAMSCWSAQWSYLLHPAQFHHRTHRHQLTIHGQGLQSAPSWGERNSPVHEAACAFDDTLGSTILPCPWHLQWSPRFHSLEIVMQTWDSNRQSGPSIVVSDAHATCWLSGFCQQLTGHLFLAAPWNGNTHHIQHVGSSLETAGNVCETAPSNIGRMLPMMEFHQLLKNHLLQEQIFSEIQPNSRIGTKGQQACQAVGIWVAQNSQHQLKPAVQFALELMFPHSSGSFFGTTHLENQGHKSLSQLLEVAQQHKGKAPWRSENKLISAAMAVQLLTGWFSEGRTFHGPFWAQFEGSCPEICRSFQNTNPCHQSSTCVLRSFLESRNYKLQTNKNKILDDWLLYKWK